MYNYFMMEILYCNISDIVLHFFVPKIHPSAGIRIILGFCDPIQIQNPFFGFEQPIFKILILSDSRNPNSLF